MFKIGDLGRLAGKQKLLVSNMFPVEMPGKYFYRDFESNTVVEFIEAKFSSYYTIWFPVEKVFADFCGENRFKKVNE